LAAGMIESTSIAWFILLLPRTSLSGVACTQRTIDRWALLVVALELLTHSYYLQHSLFVSPLQLWKLKILNPVFKMIKLRLNFPSLLLFQMTSASISHGTITMFASTAPHFQG
jgi:hypothetical protein